MNETRFVVTDQVWSLMEPECLGKLGDPGRADSDGRRFMEAVLWIVHTGSPWRDLPKNFGKLDSSINRRAYDDMHFTAATANSAIGN